MNSKRYMATHYHVTDEEIVATGRIEIYVQFTRDQAISAALYTHRLHDGNASASKNGVITCHYCKSQIAITTIREMKKSN